MTFDQCQAFHDEIRNSVNTLRSKADQYEKEGDENIADQLRAEARGMSIALSTFWRFENAKA